MPSINGQPVLPGVYDQVQQQLLASVTGGIRVVAYIGTGRLTNLVTGESVTRGSGNDDALDHTATVLDGSTITDQNFATYEAGVDYRLSGTFNVISVTDGTHLVVDNTTGLSASDTIVQGSHTTTITTVTDATHLIVGSTSGWIAGPANDTTAPQGQVQWLASSVALTGTGVAPYNGLVGATIQFSVNGVIQSVYTFVSGDFVVPTAATAAEVATAINAHFTGITADSTTVTNHVTINTNATSNSSFTVENGTSNSILGFTAGSLRSTPSRPVLGVVYFANYEWAKALGDGQNSFQPQFFFVQNFGTITNAMGTVGGGDSQTANMNGAWTIPVAAQLAQLNGASIVCLMQMNPADGSNASQVRAALQKLFIPNINIVVSLDAADNAMLIPDITAHVETASSTINRLERTAFIGFPDGTNVSDTSIALGYATAASSNRVVVVNQTSTTYSMFIGTNQTASVVNGTMMASALAALRTNPAFDVAQPLTREVVSGIATTNTLAQAAKVILSNGGVLIVDNISGSAKVVFGTTTEFDTILNQLYQVTEITDYCAQTLRGLLDPIFIGQKLLTNTPSQVETVSGAIMQTIEDSNIIESFVNPTATVNPLQPTQILLQVGVQPVLELDTILITLGLNLV